MRNIFRRQNVPWFIAGILAVALVGVLFFRREAPATATGDVTNGVVQDKSGRRVVAWVDPMYSQGPPHNYKSNKPGRAPDCNMTLVPLYADDAPAGGAQSSVGGYSVVSVPPERQQLIGVKLGKAQIRDLSRTIRTFGRVEVAETEQGDIQTRFDGYVERLFVDFTGKPVGAGQPLLTIYSPDVLATQQELLIAARNRQSLGDTFYQAARRRLLLWDISPADIAAVERTGQVQRAITLRSPFNGVVLEKRVVSGQRVMSGDTLYRIANLARVWVEADVYEAELPYVKVGQEANVTLSYFRGRNWLGRVTFVSPVVDEKTRTAKVRVEIDNRDGMLKPEMFADVFLFLPIGEVLTVPESAVIRTGTRSIVFVAKGEGHFEPREVEPGAKTGGYYVINRGVQPGETVVVDANFLIDSESRLKASIGNLGGTGSP